MTIPQKPFALPRFRLPKTAAKKLLRDGRVVALSMWKLSDLVLVVSNITNPNKTIPVSVAKCQFIDDLKTALLVYKEPARGTKYKNGMKYCSKCSSYYKTDGTYCPKCGTRLRSKSKVKWTYVNRISLCNLNLEDTGFENLSQLLGAYHGARNIHELKLVQPLVSGEAWNDG